MHKLTLQRKETSNLLYSRHKPTESPKIQNVWPVDAKPNTTETESQPVATALTLRPTTRDCEVGFICSVCLLQTLKSFIQKNHRVPLWMNAPIR